MSKDFLVGTVFLMAVLGMAGMTLTISGLDFWSAPTLLNVYFHEVSGLSEGDQVRVRGVVVGEVAEIQPPADDLVLVMLEMRKNYPVTAGSSFRVKQASALGGSYVEFKPGTGAPIGPEEMRSLPGSGSDDMFATVSEFVKDIQTSKGVLNKLLHDEDLASRVDRITLDLEEIVEKINHGKGPVAIALNDEEIAESFKRIPEILTDVADITHSINTSEGALGKLIKEESGARVVQKIFDDIEAERGVLGRIISDEQLGDDVQTAIRSLTEVMQKISEGEGVVAQLLNDPKAWEDLRETIASLESVATKMDRGNGTISRLINEGELLDEASNTLILLRDVTEDAREQAPVNAFLNALFGFF